jgi:hypothetical protein
LRGHEIIFDISVVIVFCGRLLFGLWFARLDGAGLFLDGSCCCWFVIS